MEQFPTLNAEYFDQLAGDAISPTYSDPLWFST